MKLALKIVAAFVVLVFVGLLSLRFLVPTDAIRERVAAVVEEQTGRKLTVAGDASVGGFPSLGVSLNDVSLADPAEMGDGRTVHMEALKVDLEIVPLFSRNVAIRRLVLTKPTITLRTDKDGRKNWELRRPDRANAEPSSPSEPRPKAGKSSGSLGDVLGGLALNETRIEDGALRVIDERTGRERTVEHVNLALRLPSLKDALGLSGDLVWNNQKVDLEGRVASVEALLAEEATPVTLSLSGTAFTADFEGNLKPGNALSLDGALAAKSSSLRDVLAWLGNEPTNGGFGPAELNTAIDYKPDAITFDKLRIALDGSTGQGEAQVALGGAVPKVKIKLGFDQLDLTPYMGPPEERRTESRTFIFAQAADDPITSFIRKDEKKKEKKKPSPGQPRKAQAQPKKATPKPEIAKVPPAPIQPATAPEAAPAETTAPPAEAGPVPAQPSAAAVPTPEPEPAMPAGPRTGLAAIDVDADIDIGQLTAKRIHMGKSAITAALRNGVLDAALKEADFYQGKGDATVRYDARADVPRFNGDIRLSGISALELLKDAADFDWLSGRGELTVSLAGAGKSGGEIKSSLTGQGKLTMTDGAIEGVNLPQMFRSLKQGQTRELRGEDSQKTDFSLLEGTFQMDKGIATTNDLKLTGPLVRMAAAGSIDLPENRIDMLAEPKVVASLEGQGGTEEAAGITVPLRIEGDLDHPRFTPDLKRMFSNPEQTKKTVKEIGQALKERFKGKKPRDIINSLLGKDRNSDDDALPEDPGAEEQFDDRDDDYDQDSGDSQQQPQAEQESTQSTEPPPPLPTQKRR